MLSKDQRLKRLEALREKRRRIISEKPLFVPHAEQQNVFKSKARDVFVFCGNGWGKTATAANTAKYFCEGFNPITEQYSKVPMTVHVVLDHPSKVEETWLPELKKWLVIEENQLQKNGKPYVNEVQRPNGSRIVFMFHEQPEMVFESTEFKIVIFDEPPPRKIFIAMKRGQRTIGIEPRIFCFGTPLTQAWLRQDIYERWVKGELPDVECFFGNTEANRKNLREGYIEEFAQFLTEKEKKMRFAGQFFDLEDLALAHLFTEKTHVVSKEVFNNIWDKSNPCVVAIDCHSSKPHTASLLGVDKDNQLYYIKELQLKKVAREFASELKQWYSGFRVIDIICDSSGQADMTSGEGFRSFIDVLRDCGIRVRPTSYKEKNDEDFIERIRNCLVMPKTPDNFGFYRPKLLIVEGNDGIIRNIKNVTWQKHRNLDMTKPKLEIRELDFLATLKYGLATNIYYKKDREHSRAYSRPKAFYGFSKKPKTFY